MQNHQSQQSLKKRLYQNLLNKSPKHQYLLESESSKLAPILKPKVVQQTMNVTSKKPINTLQKGKLLIQNQASQIKSPQIPKKMTPISQTKQKISKQGKAIIQQGKLKSKTNLKPHDIFAFYDAFPEMVEDFFYLNRMSHPYDYQIVTYSQRNQNQYMTISSKGVTLYHDKDAQFLTKQDWLVDQKNYYQLQKIQFFNQYKICKNFLIWKNRMRRHYMKEMSNLLNQNLFLSSTHPRNCIFEVIKITNNLKDSLYFMPQDLIQSMDPQTFLLNILKHIDSVFLPKLRGLEDMIVQELKSSIDEQIKKFKLQNNIKIQEVGSKDQNQPNKQGYVYSQEAILRKQYKKILKLIKLTDNILLQSKIQLVHKCIQQILQKVQEARSNQLKQQWITCTAYTTSQELLPQENANQNKITWNPDMEGLKTIFRTIITQAVVRINDKYQKISSRQLFQKYRVNQQSDSRKDDRRSTIKFMIQDSQFFYPLLKKIQDYLADQFKKSRKEENQLIKFIDIYNKHKSLPPVKDLFAINTASQLCQLVRQWKTDNAEMQQLPDNKSVGFLVFNYAELRKKMAFAPSQTLISFLNVLPEKTSSKCRDLSHQSKVLLQMINVYPTDITSFVSFNKCVRIATEKLDQLIDGGKQVIQMVTLIEQNKLANIDIYKGRSKQVMVSIGNLKAKVDESNAKFDQSLSKFKKQIEVSILKIKASAKELISKFQIIPFYNLSSPISSTLQKIQQIMPIITSYQQQSCKIQQTQIQLNLNQTDFKQIHQLFQKSRIVEELWSCKKEWNELLLSIYNKHYCLIDCSEIKNKWEQFYIKGSELQKKISDSQVLKKMNNQIAEFQNLIDTISHLRSPNLQQKSWRQISQYLAYELSVQNQNELPFSHRVDSQYTIEWLIKNNISLYKQKISFIVQKSEKQKQLQQSLGQFRNYLTTFIIQTYVKKRQIPLLSQNIILKQNLKQKIAILYAMIGNQYSQTIKVEAQILIKQYEYVQEILQSLYTFAKMWQKYEAFFQPNAISIKLLAKQSKEFTSWQLQWKKIIRNIISDPVYFYKKICDETTGVNCSRAIIKAISKVNGLLDMIKKGVDEFLQKKRVQFPKYFFFSDEELLKILGKLDNRQLINNDIIPLIFDSISFIDYEQQSSTVISVTLKNGQNFPLLKQSNFKSQLQMEDIFKLTEDQIKKTMNQQIRNLFVKYIEEQVSRQQMIKQNNLQVSMCVDFITWVRLAEQTYLTPEPIGSLQDWLYIQDCQIRQLHKLIKQSTTIEKFKAIQLMCQSLYFKQKTNSLSKNQVCLTDQYEWERIPKLIMTNSQIFLKQLNSKVNYCFQLLLPQQVRVIFAQNQRNWVSIINAISSKHIIGLNNGKQTLTDLAYYVGQNLKQYHISDFCHIKTVQKLFNAVIYSGCWAYLPKIQNIQILSYLASQISLLRKIVFQNAPNSVQLNKSTFLVNPNCVFFLQANNNVLDKKLIDLNLYKSVSCISPNIQKQFQIYCECDNIPTVIGNRITYICGLSKDILKCNSFIDKKMYKQIYKVIVQKQLWDHLSTAEKQNLEFIDYLILNLLKNLITQYMDQSDYQVLQTLKNSLFVNYPAVHLKLKNVLKSLAQELSHHPIIKYQKDNARSCNFYNNQFIKSAIQLYNSLTSYSKMGTILTGQVQSGKTQLIKFVCQVRKKQNQQFQFVKIYHDAYHQSDLIKSCLVEKKQKQKQRSQKSQSRSDKQKIQKSSGQIGLIQKYLQRQASQKWLIFDGLYHSQYFQQICYNSANTLLPIYGILKYEEQRRPIINKVKFMVQTIDVQNISPATANNYFVIPISKKSISMESIIKKYFSTKSIVDNLSLLSQQSSEYMASQLLFNLSKVQQKGNIRNKLIKMIYPLEQFQITLKCLTLIESVLKLNSESIRQRQKNMKKVIQKFVFWSILTTISLHVEPQFIQKFEKKALQLLKCQQVFGQPIKNYIIYPGSGLQVNVISGLRTQSCLFQIPQSGIVTLVLKNDFAQFLNNSPKGSKFYQQVGLEDPSVIRVNNLQSNAFNYFSQLLSYSNTPIVLTGQPGSGKKSIIDLLAKNNKNKAQLYSIRYTNKKSLMDMYEKPFRKFNSLNGVLLKSQNPNKNIMVSIQDMSLTAKQMPSIQFLRMLVNDHSYMTKFGQKRCWSQSNNSLCITTNRIIMDKNISRLLSKVFVFKTQINSIEKLHSIYAPFVSSWGKANALTGQNSRIFCSNNGDTILDATLSVYKLIDELYTKRKAQECFDIQTIILRPRIGDISKTLAFISRTPQAAKYSMDYYSQLWASQILRVFGDKFQNPKSPQYQMLLKQIKKESLLKFKQNFIYNQQSSLIFTNMITQNNRYYEKVQQIQTLQQFIVNLIQSEVVTIPIKLLFNDLLIQILKVYRVIEIQNGHLMLFQINKKARQYLIQLSCQIAQSNYISLKTKCLSVEKDILPVIDLDENICIYQDIQDITEEQIYQFTCLLNKNNYDFNIKTQTKEKVKNRISKYLKNIMAQIANREQPQRTTQEVRVTSNQMKQKSQTQKAQEQLFLNQKVEQEYESTMQQIFMGNTHFILGANPNSEKTRKMLLNQIDLVGNLHFNWFTISSQVQVKVSKQILTMSNEQNQNKKNSENKNTDRILKKCIAIYNSLKIQDSNFNDLFTLCQNVSQQLDQQYQKSQIKIQQWKQCIQNWNKAKQTIKQHTYKLQVYQKQFQDIKKQQDDLSNKLQKNSNQISELQLNIEQNDQNSQKQAILKNKNQEFQQIQNNLRQIKSKKDKNDLQCRQSRKIIKIASDFLDITESLQNLKGNYDSQIQNKQQKQNSIILLWSVALFGCKLSVHQIIQKASNWRNLIQQTEQSKFSCIEELISLFEPYLNHFSSQILGWQNVNQDVKLKGIMLIFLMLHQQQLTQNCKILTICDNWRITHHLFQSIPIDSILGQFNLGTILKNNSGPQLYQQIEKIKKGVIIFEEEYGQKQKQQIQKIISQRKIINFNRVVSYTSLENLADVVFQVDTKFLSNYLQMLSLEYNSPAKMSQLKNLYTERYKTNQKITQMNQSFIIKASQIDLSSQTNTEQLSKIKQTTKQLTFRLKHLNQLILSQKWLPEDKQLIQAIAQTFTNASDNQNKINLTLIKKTYIEIKKLSQIFTYQLQNKQKLQNKEKQVQDILVQNKEEQVYIQNKDIQFKNTQPLEKNQQIKNQTEQATKKENQQNLIKEMKRILQNNFSSTISGQNLLNLGLQCLKLTQKVPIIVLQNNLSSLSLIPKQAKPISLLTHNLSNLLIEVTEQIKETHKFITFYNDQIHLQTLMEIVDKYLEIWKVNHDKKSFTIFLFTNTSIAKLQQKAKLTNKAKIFHHKFKQLQMSQQQITQIQNNKVLIQKANENMNLFYEQVIENYVNINGKMLSAPPLTRKIMEADLKRLSSQLNLQSDSQLITFLKDNTPKLQNQAQILYELLKKQINREQVQDYLQSQWKINQKLQDNKKTQRKSIILNNKVISDFNNKASISQISLIQEQLPFAFNIGQFEDNPNKDSLAYDLQQLAITYNNKLKRIRHGVKNILEEYTLKANKIYIAPFILPSPQIINQINSQYRTLKKCLSYLNLINIPLQSTMKIGSNKGINNQLENDSLILRNSIPLTNFSFNKRIYHQITFRACKRLKIPLSKLKIQWVIVHNNTPIICSGLNATPEICVNLAGKIGPKQHPLKKTSQQNQSANLQESINLEENTNFSQILLLMIPYDIQSYENNQLAKEVNLKKQSSINDRQKDKQNCEKEKTQITCVKVKIPIIIQQTNQSVGFLQMTSNQLIQSRNNIGLMNSVILI